MHIPNPDYRSDLDRLREVIALARAAQDGGWVETFNMTHDASAILLLAAAPAIDALVAERDRLAAWINDAWFEGQPVPDDVFDIVERLKETT